MLALLAQAGGFSFVQLAIVALLAQAGGYSFVQLAIFAVIVLAVIALVIVATRQMGIPIPNWVWQVLGIVFTAVVIIVAIRFVASL